MRFKVEIYYHHQKRKVLFKNLTPVYYRLSNGREITVPKGFEHDFASVPKLLWGIIPSVGKHMNAAVLHDYLYDERIGRREEADHEFWYLMIRDGVHPMKAGVMYLAVRLFGGRWWKS